MLRHVNKPTSFLLLRCYFSRRLPVGLCEGWGTPFPDTNTCGGKKNVNLNSLVLFVSPVTARLRKNMLISHQCVASPLLILHPYVSVWVVRFSFGVFSVAAWPWTRSTPYSVHLLWQFYWGCILTDPVKTSAPASLAHWPLHLVLVMSLNS